MGWDFVTLYDGADNTASQLNRCHGSSCPTTVGTGTSVSVRLETDGSVTREGFTASFTCDTSAPYDPYDCTYTLVTEQKAMNAAERDCITRGGHLAAIHTPAQNAAILRSWPSARTAPGSASTTCTPRPAAPGRATAWVKPAALSGPTARPPTT